MSLINFLDKVAPPVQLTSESKLLVIQSYYVVWLPRR
jgi:hypothetical protein